MLRPHIAYPLGIKATLAILDYFIFQPGTGQWTWSAPGKGPDVQKNLLLSGVLAYRLNKAIAFVIVPFNELSLITHTDLPRTIEHKWPV